MDKSSTGYRGGGEVGRDQVQQEVRHELGNIAFCRGLQHDYDSMSHKAIFR